MRPLSARNPRVAQLNRLVLRREVRAEERAFVVEGPTLLAAALDADRMPTDLFVDEDALDRPGIAQVLQRVAMSGPDAPEPWILPAGTIDRVGDATTSQGVVAVVPTVESQWPEPAGTDLVMVLADVADPGNAGTLLRTATAAGAGAVAATGVDLTSPKVVRSSAGSVFSVDLLAPEDIVQAVRRLADAGYLTVGTTVEGGLPYDEGDYTGPTAIVVGNEAHGLAPEVIDVLDLVVTIPMSGPTESLNVAMAGTVVAFEVLRQRRHTTADTGRSRG